MASCGLWHSRGGVIAVTIDDDGRVVGPPLVAATEDERWDLLSGVDAVHGLDCALVFPDDMLKVDPIGRFALEREHTVWAVPRPLVDAIGRATALGKDARTAAMIARLTLVPFLRPYLRRVHRLCLDWRQLALPLVSDPMNGGQQPTR